MKGISLRWHVPPPHSHHVLTHVYLWGDMYLPPTAIMYWLMYIFGVTCTSPPPPPPQAIMYWLMYIFGVTCTSPPTAIMYWLMYIFGVTCTSPPTAIMYWLMYIFGVTCTSPHSHHVLTHVYLWGDMYLSPHSHHAHLILTHLGYIYELITCTPMVSLVYWQCTHLWYLMYQQHTYPRHVLCTDNILASLVSPLYLAMSILYVKSR